MVHCVLQSGVGSSLQTSTRVRSNNLLLRGKTVGCLSSSKLASNYAINNTSCMPKIRLSSFFSSQPSSTANFTSKRTQRSTIRVNAGGVEPGDKWFEKHKDISNLRDISSTEQFLDELRNAGDKLVVVDYYAGWCGACRALYPKLARLIQLEPEIICLKVNYDANKKMCKSLGVKVLPYFHIYRGAQGRVAEAAFSLSKINRLKDAISEHNTPRCDILPPPQVVKLASNL
mmetsp:Transcript_32175/g.44628  ORF Transcript_32175/g.44628 Transcript_32175/m.44628 type:complete len:230 (-) Transcript_32175:116-805(-)